MPHRSHATNHLFSIHALQQAVHSLTTTTTAPCAQPCPILRTIFRPRKDKTPAPPPRVVIPKPPAPLPRVVIPKPPDRPIPQSLEEPIARRTRSHLPTMNTAPVARRTRSQTANTASVINPAQAAQRRYPLKFLQNLTMPVLDKTSGQSLQYRQLRKHPKFALIWNTSYANKLGRLCQGIEKGSKSPRRQRVEGTNTFKLIKFADIPQDRRHEIFHSMVVCEVKPHKEEPNRTRITVAGSQICYPGDVGTPTGSLDLVKLTINIVLSRCNARFVSFDLKNFYLQTPMDRSYYVCINRSM